MLPRGAGPFLYENFGERAVDLAIPRGADLKIPLSASGAQSLLKTASFWVKITFVAEVRAYVAGARNNFLGNLYSVQANTDVLHARSLSLQGNGVVFN